MVITLINGVLLTLMAVVTIGIVRVRNLFAVVILGSIYSFLMVCGFRRKRSFQWKIRPKH